VKNLCINDMRVGIIEIHNTWVSKHDNEKSHELLETETLLEKLIETAPSFDWYSSACMY
jgi:hypothetical protein